MAYEPTVRTSGYRSAAPVWSGRGARTSKHALNIFQSLDTENYARIHRGMTPAPFRDATIRSFQSDPVPSQVTERLQATAIDRSLGNLEKFGGTGSYISEKGASNIIDSIADAWSDSKQLSTTTYGGDTAYAGTPNQ